MRGLSWREKDFRQIFLLLPLRARARGPGRDSIRFEYPASPWSVLPVVGTQDTAPRRPGPRPSRGRAGAAKARPPRRVWPIRSCGLRRRVTRGAESAAGLSTGSRLGLGALGSARPQQVGRPGGRAAAPSAPRQARYAGPRCNSSHSPPGGRPPQSRPERAAARAARSCTVSASFLQGLLGVVAFSTLTRSPWTPAPPEALRLKLLAHRPQGPSCLRSSGLGPFDEGSLFARAQLLAFPDNGELWPQTQGPEFPYLIASASSHGSLLLSLHTTHASSEMSPATVSSRMKVTT